MGLPSIWTNIFTQWFSHFVKFTKPTKDDPIVLVLDGHYSHTRNIEIIDMARENYVSIVCLPPHATHKMQPLDVGFMAPLKTYYAQEIETFLKNNSGKVVTHTIICSLFGKAYNRAATMEASINSFRKTGLFPCNRHVYRETDFLEEEQNLPTQERTDIENEGADISLNDNNISNVSSHLVVDVPAESRKTMANPSISSGFAHNKCSDKSDKLLLVSPKDVCPVPSNSSNHGENSNKRKGKASLITSTPYKKKLGRIHCQETKKKRKM